VPATPFSVTLHYKSKDSTYSGTTTSDGHGTVTFQIGTATVGYPVQVGVSVGFGKATCNTQFTPSSS
jgi:hypothetical protein